MENTGVTAVIDEIKVDWLDPNLYSDSDMSDVTDNEVLVDVNDKLAVALQEVADLQSQLPDMEAESLSKLCKNSVIDTITAQFGLVGMFLTAQDGGNITTTHNFEKGVVATDIDAKKYDEFHRYETGEMKFNEVRKKKGYDKGFNEKRKKAFQENDVIIDEYTGRPLPKDGTAQLDHIVSAKEIEINARNNLHLSPEERAKMATDDQNLAFTKSSINQSKGFKKMGDWKDEKEKKTGQTKAEKYDIDKDRAMAKDTEARKYIKKTVNQAAFKNYSKQLLVTGGKEAGLAACGTLIGVVMRDFTVALFEEIHIVLNNKGIKSFSELLADFKARMKKVLLNLKDKWKEVLGDSVFAGVTAFLSNLVVFAINLFATTLKKVVYMIRAGFVSLAQAVKLLANPPTDMPKEEVRYQALKILMVGLISSLSLGLSAAIENLLQSVPGLQPVMMSPLPFSRGQTVSDAIAVVISGIIGGVLSTIAIYFMDKLHNGNQQTGIKFQLMAADGVATQYKIAQTWLVVDAAYKYADRVYKRDAYTAIAADRAVSTTLKHVDNSLSKLHAVRERAEELGRGKSL